MLKVTGKICAICLNSLWILYQVILGTIFVAFIILLFRLANYTHWSDIRKLANTNPEFSAFMLAERERIRLDTRLSAKIKQDRAKKKVESVIWQEWISSSQIPRLVKDLVVISEDGKFYQHQGFDLDQIQYAIVANHQKGRKWRGASTISQQVVKNLFLYKERSYSRKAREAIMTILLEEYLTKDRILEIYLNIAQFGPGIFGVQAGAKHHFGKPLDNLEFNQMVSLIALLPKPHLWTPYSQYKGYVRHRARVVRNLDLYKNIRRKIPDDVYQSFKLFAEAEEAARWSKLRKNGLTKKKDSLPSKANITERF